MDASICVSICGEPIARVRLGHRRSLSLCWRRLQLRSQRAYQKQIELIGATGQPAEKGRRAREREEGGKEREGEGGRCTLGFRFRF